MIIMCNYAFGTSNCHVTVLSLFRVQAVSIELLGRVSELGFTVWATQIPIVPATRRS